MADHFAGFDVGGTKTLAVVVDDTAQVVHSERLERPCGPEATLDQLESLVTRCELALGGPITAVGVGIAGAISRTGVVQYSPNIPELVEFPLQSLLTERIARPVVVDNDATAATWAEHCCGAGRGVADLLYVALGTGIGTGFVLDGTIYRGAHGFAGEAGHMVIDRHGEHHISGARGPWEMYGSGNGLGALARSWAGAGRLPLTTARAGGPAAVRGEHVTAGLVAGETEAGALLDSFAASVAVGLTNLIYVLDPATIVVGGGLVEMGEPLRSRIATQVETTLLGGSHRPPVPVVLAQLGARSAALGAGLLAQRLVAG